MIIRNDKNLISTCILIFVSNLVRLSLDIFSLIITTIHFFNEFMYLAFSLLSSILGPGIGRQKHKFIMFA